MTFGRQELKSRLLTGESLEVTTGGGQYEVWVEPYANPPVMYYEGRIFAIGELETVIGAMLENIDRHEVQCRWLEPCSVRVKGCKEAYRRRAAESSRDAM